MTPKYNAFDHVRSRMQMLLEDRSAPRAAMLRPTPHDLLSRIAAHRPA